MTKLMDYPKYDGMECGCKVSWYFYKDRDEAERASSVARKNAVIYSRLGYDFGYCSPGSIEKVGELWKVCVP